MSKEFDRYLARTTLGGPDIGPSNQADDNPAELTALAGAIPVWREAELTEGIGRKKFGTTAISKTDSGGTPDVAIDQAYQPYQELLAA